MNASIFYLVRYYDSGAITNIFFENFLKYLHKLCISYVHTYIFFSCVPKMSKVSILLKVEGSSKYTNGKSS